MMIQVHASRPISIRRTRRRRRESAREVDFQLDRKNFPTAVELDRTLRESGGRAVEIMELTYYWVASYKT